MTLPTAFIYQGSRHRTRLGHRRPHRCGTWRQHPRRGQSSGRFPLPRRTSRRGIDDRVSCRPQRIGRDSMTSGPHLLVVDDEAGIRGSLSSILEDEGYHVEAVGSAEEALERSASGDFEVVLLDVWLPGMDGLEALSRLQASPRPPAVIMISGHGTIEN